MRNTSDSRLTETVGMSSGALHAGVVPKLRSWMFCEIIIVKKNLLIFLFSGPTVP